MKKMIKRKDGSYSQRGLWDNIRANKGSGKEPTKDMLKQESKIKKEEIMKSMYKKGGKPSKKKVMKEAKKEGESFMVENKELSFGAPQMKKGGVKKYEDGGPGKGKKFQDMTAEEKAAYVKADMKSRAERIREDAKKPGPPTADSTDYFNRDKELFYDLAATNAKFGNKNVADVYMKKASKAASDSFRQQLKGKTGFDKNGHPIKLEKTGGMKKYKNAGFKTNDPKKKMTAEEALADMRSRGSKPNPVAEMQNKVKADRQREMTEAVKNKVRDNMKEDWRYKSWGADAYDAMSLGTGNFNYDMYDSKLSEVAKKAGEEFDARQKSSKKTGGAKSMEPGGGGRFAKMVSGLKKEGKSEDSAKAIAASIGRKKYGKSKFQAMAAAGKKRMGGKKC